MEVELIYDRLTDEIRSFSCLNVRIRLIPNIIY